MIFAYHACTRNPPPPPRTCTRTHAPPPPHPTHHTRPLFLTHTLLKHTHAAAFLTQTVCLDDTTVKFEIWDTAGQERYHSLAPMYYRGAQAAIVTYDITSMVCVFVFSSFSLRLYLSLMLSCVSSLLVSLSLPLSPMPFEVWDTAGQERYHSLAPMYYRGAQAAIVTYDITRMVCMHSCIVYLSPLPSVYVSRSHCCLSSLLVSLSLSLFPGPHVLPRRTGCHRHVRNDKHGVCVCVHSRSPCLRFSLAVLSTSLLVSLAHSLPSPLLWWVYACVCVFVCARYLPCVRARACVLVSWFFFCFPTSTHAHAHAHTPASTHTHIGIDAHVDIDIHTYTLHTHKHTRADTPGHV